MDELNDGDRISHAVKGLGTITGAHKAHQGQVTVDERVADPSGPDTVDVRWDDDQFPVGPVPRGELEKVSDLTAAISSGLSD